MSDSPLVDWLVTIQFFIVSDLKWLPARHCLSMAGFFDRSSGCSIDVNYGDGDDHGRNDEKLITSWWCDWGSILFTTNFGIYILKFDFRYETGTWLEDCFVLFIVTNMSFKDCVLVYCLVRSISLPLCIWAFKICERVILRGIEWWHLTG